MARLPHRTAPAAALLLLAAGCSLPLLETGRPPEGEVRDPETDASRDRDARRRELRMSREDAEAAAREGTPSSGDSEEARRLGTSANRRIHRSDCPELLAAPAAERVPFETYWDGLNAGYAPCPSCNPGE